MNEEAQKVDPILALAINGVKSKKYTVEEAEETFGVKIPGNASSSKDNGFYYKGKTKWHPDYYGWAKYFIERYKFFSFDGGYFIYDNTEKLYRRITEIEIDYMLTLDSNNRVEPGHRNNFIRTLAASSFKVPNEMQNTSGMLNLKNGVLNVKTGEIKPHDSMLFFTYCLPHAYDPKASCNKWMKFLDDTFKDNEEMKAIAAQIFGYILIGGHPWMHRAFILYGEGRNGKSTFLDILRFLIGDNNCASVSLGKLDNPFSVVHLDGKIANIIEETPNDKINAEMFKSAIGGGKLMGSKKYENEYLFYCNARFIFACNEMPKFSEHSIGLHERMYFLPFKNYIEAHNRNGNILQELSEELPGILNWALSGLSMILEAKYLPNCASSDAVMEQYKIESDSVYAWAVETVRPDDKVQFIQSKLVYMRYREDTKAAGRSPVSDMTFYKRFNKFLRKNVPNSTSRHSDDKSMRGYSYLSLKF